MELSIVPRSRASRIISHGAAGAGPASFEVHSKSGQILEFGNTADSRVVAQGEATARSWGVNKVSDTKGNYFTVTYINDTTNGQAYPTRIDYTGNTANSLAPFNSVQFVYSATRPDIMPIYRAGSLINTTVRLANIQTYAGSALVADYRLAYEQGSSTGRSRLSTLTLCDASANGDSALISRGIDDSRSVIARERCIEQGSSPFAFQPEAVRQPWPGWLRLIPLPCRGLEPCSRRYLLGHAEFARGSATREANLRGGEPVQLRL